MIGWSRISILLSIVAVGLIGIAIGRRLDLVIVQSGFHYIVVVATFFLIYTMSSVYARLKWRDPSRFKSHIDSMLLSSSSRRRRAAVGILNNMLGGRFGVEVLDFDLTYNCWRRWWIENRNSIVWSPQLLMYVDSEWSEDEEAKRRQVHH